MRLTVSARVSVLHDYDRFKAIFLKACLLHVLNNSLDREVTSTEIGELVMEKLKELDEVAYVRFASVYRQFGDIGAFMEELKSMIKDK